MFDQKICPYHYTRGIINKVDILLIPYDYLLSSEIRRQVKLSLENKFIVIDEAHNIEEKAESLYSYKLSIKDLKYTVE